ALMAQRKQGDSRVFVTVEDFSGKFEAILYREVWVEFGALLTRDAILQFEGAISVDEFTGGYRMRVQRVEGVNTVCERRVRLVRVRLNGIDAEFHRRLHPTLPPHRGGPTPGPLALPNSPPPPHLPPPPPRPPPPPPHLP